MSLALVTMCRDEAETLLRLLVSAAPVCDRYVIVDTGSTDETLGVARAWLETHDGELHECDWQGFAASRTEALAIARGQADYLLVLDADHILHIDGELPVLTADEYMLPIRGSLGWRLPLLLKGDREWRYEGVAHAYLVADGTVMSENLDSLSVDGGPGASVEKLERDVEALSAEHARNPLDARTVFYLARSHDDLDHVQEAIHFYRARAAMNGWDQERFYARYRLGVLLCENVSYWQGARELLAAAEMLPERAAEPLRALANSGHAVADKTPVPAEGLFVHRSAYREAA